jgi:glucokinase
VADGVALPLGLVGDIGGTNARFALASLADGRPRLIDPQIYQCRDFATAEDAVQAYLGSRSALGRPTSAVLAVAGPVNAGSASLTNANWSISETRFSQAVRFSSTKLINDYAALALAAPLLEAEDCRAIGEATPGRPDQTVAILGAGTGFGVSALVREGAREAVLSTEGGHIAFAPVDTLELEILRVLSLRFGRVSIERILSGPGLLNLHLALCEIDGRPADCDAPKAVTLRAEAGDAGALRTLERFWAILGSVAGDFALAYGAQGGVYIGGGVAGRVFELVGAGGFRPRFEGKGRFTAYLQAIPTRMIRRPHAAALLGAAQALNGAAATIG